MACLTASAVWITSELPPAADFDGLPVDHSPTSIGSYECRCKGLLASLSCMLAG